MESLAEIRHLIDAGVPEAARRALAAHLTANPHHIAAWMLLATLLDDPQQQADCYRQVLSLDPGHTAAARALAQLSGAARDVVLRCPQCGGAMEIYFAGEQHDKRARCPYCATEVDLPDSFQKVQRAQTSEQGPGVQKFADTLIIESRSDGGVSPLTVEDIARLIQAQDRGVFDEQEIFHPHAYTYTKDDLRRLFAEHGVPVTDETLADFADRYRVSEQEGSGGVQRTVVRRVETRRNLGEAFSGKTAPQGCISLLLRLFGETRIVVERSRPAPPVVMDVETIVQTADRPLPPDERRSCPHCGATLSKHATWCVWCGTHLNENGGQQDAGDPSDFQGSI